MSLYISIWSNPQYIPTKSHKIQSGKAKDSHQPHRLHDACEPNDPKRLATQRAACCRVEVMPKRRDAKNPTKSSSATMLTSIHR